MDTTEVLNSITNLNSQANISNLPDVEKSTNYKSSSDNGLEMETQDAPSDSEAEAVVVELSSLAQNLQRDLLFSIDEKNGKTILKVVDRETEDIIREIPSEDIRRIKERVAEVSGLLFKDST